MNQLDVSTQFLETFLRRKVLSFSVSNGTKSGDNYMSSVYCIRVEIFRHSSESQDVIGKDETETIHLFCKCLSESDLNHQRFINGANFFWKELSIYKTWLPQIIKFQEGFLSPEDVLIPAFPPFLSGCAIDFSAYTQDAVKELKLMKPLDQHIIMMDMRKSEGFEMPSMKVTMSRDEVSMAIVEICKIHALSWAYQQKNNISDLSSLFPFLQFTFNDSKRDVWFRILDTNFKTVLDVLEFNLGKESPIYQGTISMYKNLADLIDIFIGQKIIDASKYLRIQPQHKTSEEKDISWKAMIHGDYWVNNLLFRRDSEGGKPDEVCIVDLQTFRMGCCTADFINLIYTSTDASFQELHFDEMAQLYYNKFNGFCNILKVESPPGFSLESFKARLHTGKLYGYMMTVLGAPFQLVDADDAPKIVISNNTEGANDTENLGDNNSTCDKIPASQEKRHVHNALLRDRILGIASNLYKEGII